jgi:hypothetical protein
LPAIHLPHKCRLRGFSFRHPKVTLPPIARTAWTVRQSQRTREDTERPGWFRGTERAFEGARFCYLMPAIIAAAILDCATWK